MVLGAFGAGPKAIERRNHTLEALEQSIRAAATAILARSGQTDGPKRGEGRRAEGGTISR